MLLRPALALLLAAAVSEGYHHAGVRFRRARTGINAVGNSDAVEPTADDVLAQLRSRARSGPELVDLLREVCDGGNVDALAPDVVEAIFPFPLDRFQVESAAALRRGSNVIATAPTGAGKTVIGEMAAYMALSQGKRCIYTAPLKALSNQKFSDFREQFGADCVGLLTGDVALNRWAPLLVMTTEVLRNLLYGGEDLDDVAAIVLDEFHWMGDPHRGTVWEEVVVTAPDSARLVALSATCRNAADLREWIDDVKGAPAALVQHSGPRPVPLRFLYCNRDAIFPLFQDPDCGPGAPRGLPGDRRRSATAYAESLRVRAGRFRDGEGRGKAFSSAKKASQRKSAGDLAVNDDCVESETRIAKRVTKDLEILRGSKGDPVDDLGMGRKGGFAGGRYGAPKKKKKERTPPKALRMDGKVFDGARGRPVPMAVPSFPFVVRQLQDDGLLPALVFILSRAAIDRTAKQLAKPKGDDSIGRELLSEEEVAAVRAEIDAFSEEHPDVKRPGGAAQQLLAGVGTHHAGMLPLHRGVVERLFSKGLVKVLLCTETLAAGVNLPARCTVLTQMSRRGDNGWEPLRTSSALQMAGRAGRRGKDTEGDVVLLRGEQEGPGEAAKIFLAEPEPIESNWRSTYGMAISRLQRHGGDLERCRAFVELSFGSWEKRRRLQFRAKKDAKVLQDAEADCAALEAQLAALCEQNTADGSLEGLREDLRALGKTSERIREEIRLDAILSRQRYEQSRDTAEAVLLGAPHGSALVLRDGSTGALLGDAEPSKDMRGGTLIALQRRAEGLAVLALREEHILDVDCSRGLPASAAEALMASVREATADAWSDARLSAWDTELTRHLLTDDEWEDLYARMPPAWLPKELRSADGADDGASSRSSAFLAKHGAMPGHLVLRAAKGGVLAEQLGNAEALLTAPESAFALRSGNATALRAAVAQREHLGEVLRQRRLVRKLWEEGGERAASPALAEMLALNKQLLAAERQAAKQAKRLRRRSKKQEKGAAGGEDELRRALSMVEQHGTPTPSGVSAADALDGFDGAVDADISFGLLSLAEEVSPWEVFGAVLLSLRMAGALRANEDGSYVPTSFGRLVGAVSAQNELWTASALTAPEAKDLLSEVDPPALAGLCCALLTSRQEAERYRGPDRLPTGIEILSEELEGDDDLDWPAAPRPSDRLLDIVDALEPARDRVEMAQRRAGLYDDAFETLLSPAVSGAAELWANGCSWAELKDAVALDDGDLVRLLRRTMELLRQLLLLRHPLLPRNLSAAARAALDAMNRYPVSDEFLMEARDQDDAAELTVLDDDSFDGDGDGDAAGGADGAEDAEDA